VRRRSGGTRTGRIDQIWQSDATRFLAPDWGNYWLASALDDCSRHILAWQVVADVQIQSLT
jgi:transposase InsO family protein